MGPTCAGDAMLLLLLLLLSPFLSTCLKIYHAVQAELLLMAVEIASAASNAEDNLQALVSLSLSYISLSCISGLEKYVPGTAVLVVVPTDFPGFIHDRMIRYTEHSFE